MENKEYDYINPSHYKKGDKQVYEMMIDIWGVDAYIKHCEMCAFKYRMRLGEKPDQPVERDLDKARWYETKAKELRESPYKDDSQHSIQTEGLGIPTPYEVVIHELVDESTWSKRKKATFKFFDEFPEPYGSQAKDNYEEGFVPKIPENKMRALHVGFDWDLSKQGRDYWANFRSILENE